MLVTWEKSSRRNGEPEPENNPGFLDIPLFLSASSSLFLAVYLN
jgi:hypothetical protein